MKPARQPPPHGGLPGEEIEISFSKRRSRKLAGFQVVTIKRDEGKQDLAFNSRQFAPCGLPIRRPPRGVLEYSRQNGKFFLCRLFKLKPNFPRGLGCACWEVAGPAGQGDLARRPKGGCPEREAVHLQDKICYHSRRNP